MTIWNIIVELQLIPTPAEMRRLFNQGGISLDGEVIKNYDFIVSDGTHIIQVGKRKRRYIAILNGMISKTYQVPI